MKETLELIKSTERLLTKAERKIDDLKQRNTEEQLKEVLRLMERCENIDSAICEHKGMLLQGLINILTVTKQWQYRYEKQGKYARHYIVEQNRPGTDQGYTIAYSNHPIASSGITVQGFVRMSRDLAVNGLDFDFLIKAIVTDITKSLKTTSEDQGPELVKLVKLLNEVKTQIQNFPSLAKSE